MMALLPIESALAYVGPSFLSAPGIAGNWPGKSYKGWIRLESNYWGEPLRAPPLYMGQSRNFFSGPRAPRNGEGRLSLAIDKHSPALPALLRACADKTVLPELNYAESADRARPPAELGRRPADIPEYFEYKLKGVTVGCPVVADAPEQAIVLRFADIAWLNYSGTGQATHSEPARLPAAQLSGHTQAYIVKWFWSANSVAPDQCPAMATGPSEAQYYAYKSPEVVAKEKAENAPKGGVLASFFTGKLALRGPDGLSVGLLPGIVPDPGLPAPKTDIGRGLNLDGDDGSHPPASVRPHKNFVSPEGEKGIDNQFFTVDGCVKGFGPKGILAVTTHEGRRNGEISMMILVSGIDDDKNDDRVDVTLFYSQDPMVKSASGKDILPGFTFRVTDDGERTPYFQRLRGRIVDGVVTTETAPFIEADKGRDMLRMYQGRMRLQPQPDGTLKGMIGGYLDWRTVANYYGGQTILEGGLGYQGPAIYNALKRAADGMKDPATGEFDGVSTAYEIEGVPAFLPLDQQAALLKRGRAASGKAEDRRVAAR